MERDPDSILGPTKMHEETLAMHHHLQTRKIVAYHTIMHGGKDTQHRRSYRMFCHGCLKKTYTYRVPSFFPPYNVLSFSTISLHLTLAPIPPPPATTNTSQFARIPGTPLLGASGRLNGCLHPDNISLLPSAGSTVEILLVARCHKPTTGSALLDMFFEGGEQPMKLFWVLCVVWQDGIAERRGVGQVLEEALEDAVGRPEVKSVLLG